jgi:uridine phosphorylase
MSKTLYLKCAPEEVGDLVLLTGSPERVDRIATFLDSGQIVAHNREFYTISGLYHGQCVSAVSSGIGAPSAAIAIEELKQLGVKAMVRVGTMMGVSVPMGTYIISIGAARFEGTSRSYLNMAYPAVPDWSLAQHLLSGGQRDGLDVRLGITATYDAFYPKMAPALAGHKLPDIDELRQAQVVALDMETALLYVMGLRLGISVAAMCLVTNDFAPFAMLDAATRDKGEDALIQAVLAGLLTWNNMTE